MLLFCLLPSSKIIFSNSSSLISLTVVSFLMVIVWLGILPVAFRYNSADRTSPFTPLSYRASSSFWVLSGDWFKPSMPRRQRSMKVLRFSQLVRVLWWMSCCAAHSFLSKGTRCPSGVNNHARYSSCSWVSNKLSFAIL